MSEDQKMDVICFFIDNIIQNCRELIFPMLYKCLVYFCTPCVNIADLEMLKEELIGHLTHLLIKDDLAKELFRLCRVATIKEED